MSAPLAAGRRRRSFAGGALLPLVGAVVSAAEALAAYVYHPVADHHQAAASGAVGDVAYAPGGLLVHRGPPVRVGLRVTARRMRSPTAGLMS